jgi:hypothetical protein
MPKIQPKIQLLILNATLVGGGWMPRNQKPKIVRYPFHEVDSVDQTLTYFVRFDNQTEFTRWVVFDRAIVRQEPPPDQPLEQEETKP